MPLAFPAGKPPSGAAFSFLAHAVRALPVQTSRGVAACTVGHARARIGDAHGMPADGIISHANALAQAPGAVPGRRCREAVAALRGAARSEP